MHIVVASSKIRRTQIVVKCGFTKQENLARIIQRVLQNRCTAACGTEHKQTLLLDGTKSVFFVGHRQSVAGVVRAGWRTRLSSLQEQFD
jgi:hypothetical protein